MDLANLESEIDHLEEKIRAQEDEMIQLDVFLFKIILIGWYRSVRTWSLIVFMIINLIGLYL